MAGGRPVSDFDEFVRVLGEDLLPLIEEYCYEDYPALARILGRALVDEARERIRHELLAPSRREDLIQALLAPSPELAASREMMGQTLEEDEVSEEGEEDGDGPAG